MSLSEVSNNNRNMQFNKNKYTVNVNGIALFNNSDDSYKSGCYDGKAQDQPQRAGKAHGSLAGEPVDPEKQQMQSDSIQHAQQPLRNSGVRGGRYSRLCERRKPQWSRIRPRLTRNPH